MNSRFVGSRRNDLFGIHYYVRCVVFEQTRIRIFGR